MEFPDLHNEKGKLVDTFCSEEKIAPEEVQVIASPYRICPLGAHIDHQGGPVLGMTINACTLMAFHPGADSKVRIRSRNYPGKVAFDVADIPESTGSFWGIYPWAAVRALQEKYEVAKGIVGLVDGMLPGCGLSSSASVLLAYLHGFAAANGLAIEPWEYVRLTRAAENRYIGLNNGILDQASIVFGRRGYLLHIDTKEKKVMHLADRLGDGQYRIIVAYSGYSRELTTSGYNSRVDECRQAAQQLSQMNGSAPAEILSDVEPEGFRSYSGSLEPHIRRRASHFFDESRRVVAGISAWESGSIETFGKLMSESCRSSIEQYECGVQAICDLQQIVSSAAGVFGSRFMGGGFGGCVVGFVEPDQAAAAAEDIRLSYRKLHPEVAEQTAVYLAHSDEGVRFI